MPGLLSGVYTGGRDVGTHEEGIHSDQLWFLEESSESRYYFIKNAYHQGYRLAKWGNGDQEAGVFNGQYHDDQLWRFQKEGYYHIYNKIYPSAKIAKWGRVDSNFDDQLWKMVP